ncbi:MAG: class I SAM-dependent methyltransferase [Verrucomicrobia bacterium]|nr:MAG: class I SAM-dependent methyltransferase [Verrucomicrobiota bacterium]
MNGDYDLGYLASNCFWGRDPGRLVRSLQKYVTDFSGVRVLDAGCGEGKNAAFLAQRGALVRAVDISEAALANGQSAFGAISGIQWELSDVRTMNITDKYDIVIAYGLLHCLASAGEITDTVRILQSATKDSGYNILCAFNSRAQDLSAHPGFAPTLLDHDALLAYYKGWRILEASDSDLTEVHPHNQIRHTHSLTRILAQRN